MQASRAFVLRPVAFLLTFLMCTQEAALAAPEAAALIQNLTHPIVSFELPASVGTVEDSHRGEAAAPKIILIQDAHTNPSGQKNLAKAIDRILEKEPVTHVFVEGESGDLSIAFLRDSLSREALVGAAENFLNKGLVKGSELANLASNRPFTLWGVEDKPLYDKALEAYRKAAASREKALALLDRIDRSTAAMKDVFYSDALKKLDRAKAQYESQEIGLTQYFALLDAAARETGIDLSLFSELKTLKDLQFKESSIDFAAASLQEEAAIRTLPEADRQEIASLKKPLQKVNRASAEDTRTFFLYLEEKLAGSDAGRRYPELFKYIAYIQASHSLKADKALREIDELEDLLFKTLATTSDQTALVLLSRGIELEKKLLSLQIGPDEYLHIQARPELIDVQIQTGFINKKILELKKHYDNALRSEPFLTQAVQDARAFYESSFDRDQAFVKNLSSRIAEKEMRTAILVTGGFHAKHLKELFKSRGISYVSIIPNVYHETDFARYERILLKGPAHIQPAFSARVPVSARNISDPYFVRTTPVMQEALVAAARLAIQEGDRPGNLASEQGPIADQVRPEVPPTTMDERGSNAGARMAVKSAPKDLVNSLESKVKDGLHHSDFDRSVHQSMINDLEEIASYSRRADKALPSLIKIIDGWNVEPDVRKAAIEAAAAIGPDRKEVIDILTKYLKSPLYGGQAIEALGRAKKTTNKIHILELYKALLRKRWMSNYVTTSGRGTAIAVSYEMGSISKVLDRWTDVRSSKKLREQIWLLAIDILAHYPGSDYEGVSHLKNVLNKIRLQTGGARLAAREVRGGVEVDVESSRKAVVAHLMPGAGIAVRDGGADLPLQKIEIPVHADRRVTLETNGKKYEYKLRYIHHEARNRWIIRLEPLEANSDVLFSVSNIGTEEPVADRVLKFWVPKSQSDAMKSLVEASGAKVTRVQSSGARLAQIKRVEVTIAEMRDTAVKTKRQIAENSSESRSDNPLVNGIAEQLMAFLESYAQNQGTIQLSEALFRTRAVELAHLGEVYTGKDENAEAAAQLAWGLFIRNLDFKLSGARLADARLEAGVRQVRNQVGEALKAAPDLPNLSFVMPFEGSVQSLSPTQELRALDASVREWLPEGSLDEASVADAVRRNIDAVIATVERNAALLKQVQKTIMSAPDGPEFGAGIASEYMTAEVSLREALRHAVRVRDQIGAGAQLAEQGSASEDIKSAVLSKLTSAEAEYSEAGKLLEGYKITLNQPGVTENPQSFNANVLIKPLVLQLQKIIRWVNRNDDIHSLLELEKLKKRLDSLIKGSREAHAMLFQMSKASKVDYPQASTTRLEAAINKVEAANGEIFDYLNGARLASDEERSADEATGTRVVTDKEYALLAQQSESPFLMADGILRTRRFLHTPQDLSRIEYARWGDDVADVAVIGAGPAGLSAGLHAVDAKLKTVIVSDYVGGGFSDAKAHDTHWMRTNAEQSSLVRAGKSGKDLVQAAALETQLAVYRERGIRARDVVGRAASRQFASTQPKNAADPKDVQSPLARNEFFQYLSHAAGMIQDRGGIVVEGADVASIEKKNDGLYWIRTSQGHLIKARTLVPATGMTGRRSEHMRMPTGLKDFVQRNKNEYVLVTSHEELTAADRLIQLSLELARKSKAKPGSPDSKIDVARLPQLIISETLMGTPLYRTVMEGYTGPVSVAVVGGGEAAAKAVTEILDARPEATVHLYTVGLLKPGQLQVPAGHAGVESAQRLITDRQAGDTSIEEWKRDYGTTITPDTFSAIERGIRNGRVVLHALGAPFDTKAVKLETVEITPSDTNPRVRTKIIPLGSRDRSESTTVDGPIILATGYDRDSLRSKDPVNQALIAGRMLKLRKGDNPVVAAEFELGPDNLSSGIDPRVYPVGAINFASSVDSAVPGMVVRSVLIAQAIRAAIDGAAADEVKKQAASSGLQEEVGAAIDRLFKNAFRANDRSTYPQNKVLVDKTVLDAKARVLYLLVKPYSFNGDELKAYPDRSDRQFIFRIPLDPGERITYTRNLTQYRPRMFPDVLRLELRDNGNNVLLVAAENDVIPFSQNDFFQQLGARLAADDGTQNIASEQGPIADQVRPEIPATLDERGSSGAQMAQQGAMGVALNNLLPRLEQIQVQIGLDYDAGYAYPNKQFSSTVEQALRVILPEAIRIVRSNAHFQGDSRTVPPGIYYIREKLSAIPTQLSADAPNWQELPDFRWHQLKYACDNIDLALQEIDAMRNLDAGARLAKTEKVFISFPDSTDAVQLEVSEYAAHIIRRLNEREPQMNPFPLPKRYEKYLKITSGRVQYLAGLNNEQLIDLLGSFMFEFLDEKVQHIAHPDTKEYFEALSDLFMSLQYEIELEGGDFGEIGYSLLVWLMVKNTGKNSDPDWIGFYRVFAGTVIYGLDFYEINQMSRPREGDPFVPVKTQFEKFVIDQKLLQQSPRLRAEAGIVLREWDNLLMDHQYLGSETVEDMLLNQPESEPRPDYQEIIEGLKESIRPSTESESAVWSSAIDSLVDLSHHHQHVLLSEDLDASMSDIEMGAGGGMSAMDHMQLKTMERMGESGRKIWILTWDKYLKYVWMYLQSAESGIQWDDYAKIVSGYVNDDGVTQSLPDLLGLPRTDRAELRNVLSYLQWFRLLKQARSRTGSKILFFLASEEEHAVNDNLLEIYANEKQKILWVGQGKIPVLDVLLTSGDAYVTHLAYAADHWHSEGFMRATAGISTAVWNLTPDFEKKSADRSVLVITDGSSRAGQFIRTHSPPIKNNFMKKRIPDSILLAFLGGDDDSDDNDRVVPDAPDPFLSQDPNSEDAVRPAGPRHVPSTGARLAKAKAVQTKNITITGDERILLVIDKGPKKGREVMVMRYDKKRKALVVDASLGIAVSSKQVDSKTPSFLKVTKLPYWDDAQPSVMVRKDPVSFYDGEGRVVTISYKRLSKPKGSLSVRIVYPSGILMPVKQTEEEWDPFDGIPDDAFTNPKYAGRFGARLAGMLKAPAYPPNHVLARLTGIEAERLLLAVIQAQGVGTIGQATDLQSLITRPWPIRITSENSKLFTVAGDGDKKPFTIGPDDQLFVTPAREMIYVPKSPWDKKAMWSVVEKYFETAGEPLTAQQMLSGARLADRKPIDFEAEMLGALEPGQNRDWIKRYETVILPRIDRYYVQRSSVVTLSAEEAAAHRRFIEGLTWLDVLALGSLPASVDSLGRTAYMTLVRDWENINEAAAASLWGTDRTAANVHLAQVLVVRRHLFGATSAHTHRFEAALRDRGGWKQLEWAASAFRLLVQIARERNIHPRERQNVTVRLVDGYPVYKLTAADGKGELQVSALGGNIAGWKTAGVDGALRQRIWFEGQDENGEAVRLIKDASQPFGKDNPLMRGGAPFMAPWVGRRSITPDIKRNRHIRYVPAAQGPDQFAIHGYFDKMRWEYAGHSSSDDATSITLVADTAQDPIFEFKDAQYKGSGRVYLTYTLGKDGSLNVKTRIENTGGVSFQMGFGHHPWFLMLNPTQVEARIPARGVRETIPSGLSTLKVIPVTGTAQDYLAAPRKLEKEKIDATFTDLESADGVTVSEFTNPQTGEKFVLTQKGYSNVHLFVPQNPTVFPADIVAVEPTTSRAGTSDKVIAPGGSVTAEWTAEFGPAAARLADFDGAAEALKIAQVALNREEQLVDQGAADLQKKNQIQVQIDAVRQTLGKARAAAEGLARSFFDPQESRVLSYLSLLETAKSQTDHLRSDANDLDGNTYALPAAQKLLGGLIDQANLYLEHLREAQRVEKTTVTLDRSKFRLVAEDDRPAVGSMIAADPTVQDAPMWSVVDSDDHGNLILASYDMEGGLSTDIFSQQVSELHRQDRWIHPNNQPLEPAADMLRELQTLGIRTVYNLPQAFGAPGLHTLQALLQMHRHRMPRGYEGGDRFEDILPAWIAQSREEWGEFDAVYIDPRISGWDLAAAFRLFLDRKPVHERLREVGSHKAMIGVYASDKSHTLNIRPMPAIDAAVTAAQIAESLQDLKSAGGARMAQLTMASALAVFVTQHQATPQLANFELFDSAAGASDKKLKMVQVSPKGQEQSMLQIMSWEDGTWVIARNEGIHIISSIAWDSKEKKLKVDHLPADAKEPLSSLSGKTYDAPEDPILGLGLTEKNGKLILNLWIADSLRRQIAADTKLNYINQLMDDQSGVAINLTTPAPSKTGARLSGASLQTEAIEGFVRGAAPALRGEEEAEFDMAEFDASSGIFTLLTRILAMRNGAIRWKFADALAWNTLAYAGDAKGSDGAALMPAIQKPWNAQMARQALQKDLIPNLKSTAGQPVILHADGAILRGLNEEQMQRVFRSVQKMAKVLGVYVQFEGQYGDLSAEGIRGLDNPIHAHLAAVENEAALEAGDTGMLAEVKAGRHIPFTLAVLTEAELARLRGVRNGVALWRESRGSQMLFRRAPTQAAGLAMAEVDPSDPAQMLLLREYRASAFLSVTDLFELFQMADDAIDQSA